MAIPCAATFGYALEVLYDGDPYNRKWTAIGLAGCVAALLLLYAISGIGLHETSWTDPAYQHYRAHNLGWIDPKHWIMLGSTIFGYLWASFTRKPEPYG